MFYTDQLQNDGSLSLVWLAAHSAKHLKKKETVSCNLESACDAVLAGSFALRLSAFLVLGLYKVYDKQMTFLLQDCSHSADKSTVQRKKLPSHTIQLDLTQNDLMDIDDDHLMETLSLSMGSNKSIELNRGLETDLDLPLAFSEHNDINFDLEDTLDQSREVGRRESVADINEPYLLQDDSILPVPQDVGEQLKSEERAFSDRRSISSLQDLALELSLPMEDDFELK